MPTNETMPFAVRTKAAMKAQVIPVSPSSLCTALNRSPYRTKVDGNEKGVRRIATTPESAKVLNRPDPLSRKTNGETSFGFAIRLWINLSSTRQNIFDGHK